MRKLEWMPVLLALLLAGLCLTGLAGCAERGGDTAALGTERNEPVTAPDGPLTEGELKYFNEEFFNSGYFNLRNQFLTSVYETPADIDLFELFYNGDGQEETMTDEEWAAFEEAGGFIETDVTKISTIWADAVLKEHTGLTLAETNQAGLDNFIYLPEYDAYYMAHGDTNYLNEVVFVSGEWKDGLIRLYYADEVSGARKCVSLRETAEGGYHFVSNMFCDEPVS